MHRIVFTLAIVPLFWVTKGQVSPVTTAWEVNPQVVYYDSLTYAQYLKQDYKLLIATAKEAKLQGVAFPYLHYRKAIAHYELKNYAGAVKAYEEALPFFPDDLFLKESLYLAYRLSGQNVKADIFAKTLPGTSRERLGVTSSLVDFIRFSGGYTFSENNEKMRNNIANLDTINQYQDMMLGGVIVGLNISDRVKLKAAYNLFNTRFERFARNRLQHNDLLSQHQFNLGMEFYLGNNFSAGFTGGFYAIEKNNKSTAQLWNGAVGGGRKPTIPSSRSTNYHLSALIFLNKQFTHVVPEISFAYSDFAFSHQFQSKLQLVYYPLGNLNFYGITSGAILLDSDKNRGKQTIFSQSVGVKLVGSMWLDGAVSVGNHLNYITDRSFVVYDTYDPVTFISSLSLSYYLKKMTLSATYSWTEREGWAFTDYYTRFLKYKYNNHLINLAIQWNL